MFFNLNIYKKIIFSHHRWTDKNSWKFKLLVSFPPHFLNGAFFTKSDAKLDLKKQEKREKFEGEKKIWKEIQEKRGKFNKNWKFEKKREKYKKGGKLEEKREKLKNWRKTRKKFQWNF